MFQYIDCALLERREFIIENGSHETDTLLIPVDGSFRFRCCGGEQTAARGNAVFFKSGEVFTRKIIRPIRVYYIPFACANPAFVPKHSCMLHVDPRRVEENLRLLERDQAMTVHVTADLFYQHHFAADPGGEGDLVDDVIRTFRQRLSAKLNLTDLANHYGLSESGLIYKFKKQLGITPIEALIKLRMEHAAALLLNSDLKVYEIAADCGYENEFYFSNAFKKQTGLSPSAYRKKYMI